MAGAVRVRVRLGKMLGRAAIRVLMARRGGRVRLWVGRALVWACLHLLDVGDELDIVIRATDGPEPADHRVRVGEGRGLRVEVVGRTTAWQGRPDDG